MRNGAIIDMEQAELALRTTVHAWPSRWPASTIQEVVINLSGGYPASQTVGVEVPISGREIADHDLHRVLMQGAQVHGPGRPAPDPLHPVISYSIDGSGRASATRAACLAEKLGVDMHVVTAAAGAVKNLTTCVARCHLEPARHRGVALRRRPRLAGR